MSDDGERHKLPIWHKLLGVVQMEKDAAEWRTVAIAVLALISTGGAGVFAGSQLGSNDSPEVVAYRLGKVEEGISELSDDLRTLNSGIQDRWTRSDHDQYASTLEARLRAIETGN